MFWVLQSNLYDEAAFQALLQQLERQNTQFSVVKMIPFVGEIEPDINVEGPVFVCGSTAIKKVAQKKDWIPGYFDENIDMSNLMREYGENMLNHGAIFGKMRDMQKPDWGDRFFLRPASDGKSFAGMVMNWNDFVEWQQKVIALDGESSLTTLCGDDIIVFAPIREILSEYRFFVVDGKVITGSRYKLGGRVVYSTDVDEAVTDFAQSMVNIWQPCRAFAIDIANTPDGFKVIEINSINSAGFYLCDMGKFVNAINSMPFRLENKQNNRY